jgi:hypothetical protein
MSFQNRMKDPRILMPIGMMCLLFAILGPMLFQPATQFGQNMLHGVRGFLFGLSITFNLFAALRIGRLRRSGGN